MELTHLDGRKLQIKTSPGDGENWNHSLIFQFPINIWNQGSVSLPDILACLEDQEFISVDPMTRENWIFWMQNTSSRCHAKSTRGCNLEVYRKFVELGFFHAHVERDIG